MLLLFFIYVPKCCITVMQIHFYLYFQLHLTHGLIDLLLISINSFLMNINQNFHLIHSLVISMLSTLLKYRKSLILDRLPPFLQNYRSILKNLCKKSNSDLNLNDNDIRQLSDCAHQLEKLTRILVGFPKDMGRIAMYLIADILNQYEQITLYANVKVNQWFLRSCIRWVTEYISDRR